jgi:hypothetical protein
MTEKDKLKHFWYSFFIAVGALLLVSEPKAFLLTFMVGVAKEIWDKYYGSGFCYYDIAANCLGIMMAFSVYYFIFKI